MQFSAHLLPQLFKKPILPIYWVHGDAWFLVEEARLNIRAHAKAHGYTLMRSRSMESDITWPMLQETTRQSSLFSEHSLIDIELSKSSLTAEGIEVLKTLCACSVTDTIYLFVLRHALDKKHMQSEWFRAMDSIGAIVDCTEPVGNAFTQWLMHRIRYYEMTFDQDAFNHLAEWTAGNLLAADQTLRGLQALNKTVVSKTDVENLGTHDPRFATFALVDVARAGKYTHIIHMIDTLRTQRVDPILVLWVLARECRQRLSFLEQCAAGVSPQMALKSLSIFPKYQIGFQRAAEQNTIDIYRSGLQLASHIDASIKGVAQGDVWLLLKTLAVYPLSGGREVTHLF